MPLTSGTRLGPYQILAPLGAGGMGEVYRARDTRLGRDVAIKLLPQHLGANADVRALRARGEVGVEPQLPPGRGPRRTLTLHRGAALHRKL